MGQSLNWTARRRTGFPSAAPRSPKLKPDSGSRAGPPEPIGSKLARMLTHFVLARTHFVRISCARAPVIAEAAAEETASSQRSWPRKGLQERNGGDHDSWAVQLSSAGDRGGRGELA